MTDPSLQTSLVPRLSKALVGVVILAATILAPAAVAQINATATLAFAPPAPLTGQSVSVTATLTGAAGTPTGLVILVLDNTTYGTPKTLVGGSYTFTPANYSVLASLTAGPHVFAIQYSGDVHYNAGQLGSTTVQVKGVPTGVLSTIPASPISYNAPVSAHVVISPAPGGAAVSGGTLSVYEGGVLLATAVVSGATTDIALPNSISVAIGPHLLTVQYSGDSNYTGFATAPSVTLTVNASVVPVPPTLLLVGTGLAAAGLLSLRRRLAFRG